MKILYISASAQMGGAEVCLLDIMASIRAYHPDWKLVLIAPSDGPLLARAHELCCDAKVVPYPESIARLGDSPGPQGSGKRPQCTAVSRKLACAAPSILTYTAALRRQILRIRPDVVHVHSLKANILAGWTVGGKIPVIWHFHDYLGERTAIKYAHRHSMSRCSVMVANSGSVADDVRSCCRNRRAIHTIHNAVALEEFSPEGDYLDLDTAAGMLSCPNGIVRIGLVSTMAWWKGQKDFIRAISLVPRCAPIRAYLIGGPLYQTDTEQFTIAELGQFATSLGVADRIGFTGFVPRPAAAMRTVDIVVHASNKPEPFGRVIVEAMACAKPVISTAMGGAAELVEDGVTALTYPAGDASALAARIVQLAADPSLRHRLGAAGRAVAVAKFDRLRLGAVLSPIYFEAIAHFQRA